MGSDTICPYCGHDNSITIMTEREKNNYRGVTIEENIDGDRPHVQYSRGRRSFNFSFGSSGLSGSWFSRILWGIGIIAVISFILFVALPFLSIAVLSVLVIWAVFRLLH